MKRANRDKLINAAFDLLLTGLTPKEIKTQMYLTEDEWRYMCSSSRFMTLLHSSKDIPQTIKIKEIEDNLFGLLSLPNRDYLTNKRIDALTYRYATILL